MRQRLLRLFGLALALCAAVLASPTPAAADDPIPVQPFCVGAEDPGTGVGAEACTPWD